MSQAKATKSFELKKRLQRYLHLPSKDTRGSFESKTCRFTTGPKFQSYAFVKLLFFSFNLIAFIKYFSLTNMTIFV